MFRTGVLSYGFQLHVELWCVSVLHDRDRSILEAELITDASTLRSLSELELLSVGITPASVRQKVFLQHKQQYVHMQKLVEGLLDESAILEEIVQLVWDRRFRSKLTEFKAYLSEQWQW